MTGEAGVAKGVLHRHFADFDDFLAELVRDRIRRVGVLGDSLADSAGTGSVAGQVSDALTMIFEPVAVSIVGLVTFRDGLRGRLRAECPRGIPLLADAVSALRDYLAAEQRLGRLTAGADPTMLAPALVGAAHLLFADRAVPPPDASTVHALVQTVAGAAITQNAGSAGPAVERGAEEGPA